ncbi:LLM class flavin-dependent oxidoreductase [Kitasatospora sp. NPDC059408]|uniref:LLM class flavin-dependent oxidoreductase n=1 Tax=Kitasatospora sp. NPDC059408 TaxID=3346823 RepID=UPI0036A1E018
MNLPQLPLSALDILPVEVGSEPAAILKATCDLAAHVESLGFTRYWVAEHHNTPNIASSAPPVIIAALGAATSSIRVGSGGMMLPNHAPLVVAEQFGTLNALYPGRVDLGVGRSTPTDARIARALRFDARNPAAHDFNGQLADLIGFLRNDFPADHPLHGVSAVPVYTEQPSLWLLGSSDNGARLAAELGLPFAFAHHFNPRGSASALRLYKELFRPSEFLSRPYSIVAVSVVCAETDERARWLAAPAGLALLRSATAKPEPFPTPEEAAAHAWTPDQQAFLNQFLGGQAVGGPDRVRERLSTVLEESGADELMAVTMVADIKERTDSMNRLRGLFGDAELPKGPAF